MYLHKKPIKWHGTRKRGIDAIVIHYISGGKWTSLDRRYDVDTVCSILEKYQLSYHYSISREGDIFQHVQDRRRAYHAGHSILHGQLDQNQNSIGIALHGEKDVPFTQPQIDALVRLVVSLRGEYPIALNRIVGHDQITYHRKHAKIDPGPLFPWLMFLDRVGKGGMDAKE